MAVHHFDGTLGHGVIPMDDMMSSTTGSYRGFIRDQEHRRTVYRAYLEKYNSEGGNCNDYPRDKNVERGLVSMLFTAAMDSTTAIEPATSQSIGRLSKGDWGDLAIEHQMWAVLEATQQAQLGVCSIPPWSASKVQPYKEYPSFMERFEAVKESLQLSKDITVSVLKDPIYVHRLAWNPKSELDVKVSNRKVNKKKNENQKLAQEVARRENAKANNDGKTADAGEDTHQDNDEPTATPENNLSRTRTPARANTRTKAQVSKKAKASTSNKRRKTSTQVEEQGSDGDMNLSSRGSSPNNNPLSSNSSVTMDAASQMLPGPVSHEATPTQTDPNELLLGQPATHTSVPDNHSNSSQHHMGNQHRRQSGDLVQDSAGLGQVSSQGYQLSGSFPTATPMVSNIMATRDLTGPHRIDTPIVPHPFVNFSLPSTTNNPASQGSSTLNNLGAPQRTSYRGPNAPSGLGASQTFSPPPYGSNAPNPGASYGTFRGYYNPQSATRSTDNTRASRTNTPGAPQSGYYGYPVATTDEIATHSTDNTRASRTNTPGAPQSGYYGYPVATTDEMMNSVPITGTKRSHAQTEDSGDEEDAMDTPYSVYPSPPK
ncbi:hypothetical protein GGR53DRAFT_468506 [Hypoxylon sp. FL1150]|nr:hypothetical protein GGR53DRAFT_468506 [Hypoxylon sp. FL1150]